MSKSALLTLLSGWPRRAAAVLCLIAAGLTAVSAHGGRPRETTVLVAKHLLPAGRTVQPTDLRPAAWPTSSVPPAAARSPVDVVGRRTAVAIPAGTPLSPDGLMEPAMARALAAGQIATTVSLANGDALSILQAGSYIDLYVDDVASSVVIEGKSIPGGSTAIPAATGVLVLSVLAGSNDDGRNGGPALVIAAARPAIAKLSSHAGATFIATLVAPP